MGIKRLKKGGGGSRLGQTFGLAMDGSGISELPQDLTINGTTVSPTFLYEAKNATTSTWTATVGENLSGAGSGGTVGLDTPFISDDEAVNNDSSRRWDGTGNQFDVAGKDIIFETILKIPSTNGLAGYVFSNRSTTNSDGCFCYVSITGTVSFYIEGATGGQYIQILGLPTKTWLHLMLFVDASTRSFAWYANGGAYSSISTYADPGTIDSSNAIFNLGARNDGFAGGCNIITSYVAGYTGTDILDTHLQADLAKERFYKLCGIYPELAKGTALPTSYTRATTAYLDKFVNATGSLFQVGSGWPRVCQRTDLSGSSFVGYLAEEAETNLFTFSQDFDNAAWTKTRSFISGSAGTSPDGSNNASILVEDASAATSHFIGFPATLSTSTQYTYSVWAKAINRSSIALQFGSVPGNPIGFFDLSTGTAGTTSGLDSSGIEDWGNGWFRCWTTFTSDGTDATGDLRVFIAEADNDAVFDGLSQDSLYIWQADVVAAPYPTSPIYTSGSTAARNADVLYYKGDDGNVVNNQQGTLACDVLLPDFNNTSVFYCLALSDGGSAADTIANYIDTNDVANAYSAATGGSLGSVVGTTDITDGVAHNIRNTWVLNNQNLYVDGSAEGIPDTNVGPADDLDRIHVGSNASLALQPNGIIGNVKIFRKPTTKG